MKNIERSLASVDKVLLRVLNDLVSGKRRWPLFLWGPPGRGKSCAALAMCDIAQTAAFWVAEDLATFVLKGEYGDVEYEFKELGKKSLAVLDEIGARERVGDLAYSVAKRFSDVREIHAGRVAIYVSNVPPHELADIYDDRLASRMLCGEVFELKGADRRKVGR